MSFYDRMTAVPKAPLRVSPSERALSHLSALIDKKDLRQGELLPSERKLMAELGISRVVIRETLKKLEQRGLVRIRHGIGVELLDRPGLPVEETINRALPESHDRLRQCAQARQFFEPEIAAFAATRVTPTAVRKLSGLIESMKTATTVDEAANFDIAFHDAIAELAGNKVLLLMLQSIAEIGRISRAITMCRVGSERACVQHTKILEAIAAGDSESARRAMRKHLESALSDLGF
jgi:GntR family transcriptional repressor for pyruvate dehydrogenase complex